MLSISEQVALMRQFWPGFTVGCQTSWFVSWKGRLRPFHQNYVVRVFFCLGCDLDNATILPDTPRVTVSNPLPTRRTIAPEVPIPHHYPNRNNPEYPILCLHDPRECEWWFDDAIAETTLPWAVNWLACYEGWQATGEWAGGGRHPTQEEYEEWKGKKTHRSGPQARFNAAAFNRLGQKTGTFASFPLMVAASGESFRPLSWRDWNNVTSVADLWRSISTSSPEPPRVESSPSAWPPVSPAMRLPTSTSTGAMKSSRRQEMGLSARPTAA